MVDRDCQDRIEIRSDYVAQHGFLDYDREESEFTSQFQSGIKLRAIEDPEMDSVFSSFSLYISFLIPLQTVCIVLNCSMHVLWGGVYKVKEDEEEEWWRMLSDSCNKICKMMSFEADKYSVELWPLDTKEEERGKKSGKEMCVMMTMMMRKNRMLRVACRTYLERSICMFIYPFNAMRNCA